MRGVWREERRAEGRQEGREEVILAFLFFGVLGRGNRLSSYEYDDDGGETQDVSRSSGKLETKRCARSDFRRSDVHSLTGDVSRYRKCPRTALDSSHVKRWRSRGPQAQSLRLRHSVTQSDSVTEPADGESRGSSSPASRAISAFTRNSDSGKCGTDKRLDQRRKRANSRWRSDERVFKNELRIEKRARILRRRSCDS